MKEIIIGVTTLALASTLVHADSQPEEVAKIEKLAETHLQCAAFAHFSGEVLPEASLRKAKHNFLGLNLFQRMRERIPFQGKLRQQYPDNWSDRDISFAEAGSQRAMASTFILMELQQFPEAERPLEAIKMYAAFACDNLIKELSDVR